MGNAPNTTARGILLHPTRLLSNATTINIAPYRYPSVSPIPV